MGGNAEECANEIVDLSYEGRRYWLCVRRDASGECVHGWTRDPDESRRERRCDRFGADHARQSGSGRTGGRPSIVRAKRRSPRYEKLQ